MVQWPVRSTYIHALVTCNNFYRVQIFWEKYVKWSFQTHIFEMALPCSDIVNWCHLARYLAPAMKHYPYHCQQRQTDRGSLWLRAHFVRPSPSYLRSRRHRSRRGTCLRRPLGTRRPPRLFEKLESYCIKLASLITRYSVLIYCAKEKNCKISSWKDLQTER